MRNPVNYEAVINGEGFVASLNNSDRDINLFLPVRGRLTFLGPCLTHIKEASKRAGIRVNVVVVENDDTSKYGNYCINQGIDYIFIPTQISCSNGLFAKALCYNIGFLKVKRTEWNVFHDLDIMVDKDYFTKLMTYLTPSTTWVQPYTQKRVMRLNAAESNKIVRNPEVAFCLEGLGTPATPGSPGGSIVVRSLDFISIGGYDPEYFYGYSPEDAFFWAKLEVLHKVIEDPFEEAFQGSAVYADSPAMEVYHLDHPCEECSNAKLHLMLSYLSSFYRSSYQKKREFIDRKKEYFIYTLNRMEQGEQHVK